MLSISQPLKDTQTPDTPVFKVYSPQPLIRVLVDFRQSEYVVAAKELVGPPSPKGYVRQLDLIEEFFMKCIVRLTKFIGNYLVSLLAVVNEADEPPSHLSHSQHGRGGERAKSQHRCDRVWVFGSDGSL